ncbi:PepSY domain-containing protein [Pseudomonas syringae]|nr:PepSY domain-containing protein [Pseudomonas syringae]MBD8803177.1 PepSY domain-containing protein [Pseudomonas syringae]MBD8813997.1 PepSY domain-containing protein [Pseudomonas syringae]
MSHAQHCVARSGTLAPVALLRRLHFYIGLLIGPFLLVAALSGVAYALTPQLENWLYADVLHTDNYGAAKPLDEQIQRALESVGAHTVISAVRPAPRPGDTTRVMVIDAAHGASESRAIFVDPVTSKVLGQLNVYGTSGVLPLRTAIDQFHRSLLLGEAGRLYSELAASWLWLAALGGLALWYSRRAPTGKPDLRSVHRTLGLWLLLGLLFFSATGLTWSRYAGENIGVFRAAFGWSTPAVRTTLGSDNPAASADEHAGHHQHGMEMPMPTQAPQAVRFAQVLDAARAAGIQAGKVEIKPGRDATRAWVVSEIDRSWPTRVDAVAVNPRNLKVIDHVAFSEYSLPAKLTRWGVDAHMGVLFGLVNQLILVITGLGLAVMVVLGYLMWWRRRPVASPQTTVVAAWRQLSMGWRYSVVIIAVLIGYALPVLGTSLLGLLALDLLLTLRAPANRVVHESR